MATKDRGGRDGKRRRAARSVAESLDVEWAQVPIVGKVRMVRGTDGHGWTYDPTFVPELPSGAVRGDISRQVYCCSRPRFAYVDIRRTCVQCAGDFVFSASEQKYWYERLQFRLDSHAIRCPPCRRSRRTDKAVAARYAAAVARRGDGDAANLVEFASALCALIDRGLGGQPDEIIAAARRAQKEDPGWPEPIYWEARGHEHAGREAKAAAAYDRFLAAATKVTPAARRLIADAVGRRGRIVTDDLHHDASPSHPVSGGRV